MFDINITYCTQVSVLTVHNITYCTQVSVLTVHNITYCTQVSQLNGHKSCDSCMGNNRSCFVWFYKTYAVLDFS